MSAGAPSERDPGALDALLRRCVAAGASDLHLAVGQPPILRVDGELRPVSDAAPLGAAELEGFAREALDPAQREAFARERAIDLARSLPDGARFRLNVFSERTGLALAIRRLDERIQPLDALHLPPLLERLTELDEGLVLLTGATGSGKTTTLAALLDRINHTRACHILTLEDPIEYLHPSRRALVRQRQLHTDFGAFADALRAALREDPDVILVGEMRDTDTMRTALMAAETGHLVFSTLHAGSAVGATERLIGAFPGDERDSIRHQLSLVLRAVVAQRLLRGRSGRVPAVEVMTVTFAVANLIRTGKTAQLQSAMEGQTAAGMLTLEQSLAEAVERGWLADDVARRAAREPGLFEDRLRVARQSGAPRPSGGGPVVREARAPWR